MITTQTNKIQLSLKQFNDMLFRGRFKFTVVSSYTETRYTFKITGFRDNNYKERKAYAVAVFTGTNNDTDYTTIGYIFCSKLRDSSTFKKKDYVINLTAQTQAFQWLLRNKSNEEQLNKVQVFNEGRCACCGRTLTDPESIMLGYGSECYSRINPKQISRHEQ